MNPERFKDVERLYTEVLNVSPIERNTFLQENCGDDIELRNEIESLLSFENSFDSRIDTPPESLVEEVFSKNDNLDFVGRMIKHYKVLSLLGKGGMGSVYLAQDTVLGRNVAVKLMANDIFGELGKTSRFFQEAKSASALNHPSILTVHEFGEHDGANYIVTEYVEGKTLSRYLENRDHSLRSLLEIAQQIGSALATAHEAGIIHRDIKPDNIMIRKDGVPKVLDFGLAKLTGSGLDIDLEAETIAKHLTVEGMIIGTPQYMSPEQARGQQVDSRTDIFSFGILLYEMIAGKPPFTGVNEIDTIGAILKDEPKPLSEYLPDLPQNLERIVEKSLRKDREKRYQHIKDLLIDLDDVENDLEPEAKVNQITNQNIAAPTLHTSSGIVTERRFSLIHVFAFLLIIAIGVGAFWWFGAFKTSPVQVDSQLKTTEVVNWNSSPGEVYSVGSFSPDAKMVAFASTKSGNQNIWIKQTNSGESIQITKDEFRNENPIWSPGGDELAFFSVRGNQAGIWRMPVLGGSPTSVTTVEDGSCKLLRWSPKGLIYYKLFHDVFAVDVNSGQTKKVADFTSKQVNAESLSISPDEKRLAYTLVDGDQWSLWSKDLQDGEPKKLFSSTDEIKNTSWHPDNSRVLYSASVNGTFQIFVTDTIGTQPQQISFAERDSFVLDVSSDGTRILFGSAKEDSDIWGINIKDTKEFIVASEIDSEFWADVSPDGRSIAYQSVKNLSQGNNIFSGKVLTKTLNADDRINEISSDGFLPTWSPDGQMIAFMKVVGDKYRIETVKSVAGGQKLLAADDVAPVTNSVLPYNRLQTSYFSWSPDSSKIAYISGKSGQLNIWLVNADGSNNIKLTSNEDSKLNLYCPIWSPDGKQIAFTSKTQNTSSEGKPTFGVWTIDTETKHSIKMTQKELYCRLIGWTQSGREVLLASIKGSETSSLPTEVSVLQLETGTGNVNPVAVLKDTYPYNIYLSPNGKDIAFTANSEGKDNIWLIAASGSEAKILTDNKDSRIYFSSLAWSPDNNSIFFGKQSRYSLLSMLSNFR